MDEGNKRTEDVAKIHSSGQLVGFMRRILSPYRAKSTIAGISAAIAKHRSPIAIFSSIESDGVGCGGGVNSTSRSSYGDGESSAEPCGEAIEKRRSGNEKRWWSLVSHQSS